MSVSERKAKDLTVADARARIDATLFDGVPNAEHHSNAQRTLMTLGQAGVRADNYEHAAQVLVDQPEFAEINVGRSIRELRLLLREGDRLPGVLRRPGVMYGSGRNLDVSSDVVDALVAFIKRKLGNKKIEFPEPEKAPAQSTPRTINAFLKQRGDALMEIFTETLGLPARPFKTEALMPALLDGLVEADVVSANGNISKNAPAVLADKAKAFHADEDTDGKKQGERLTRYKKMIKALSFTRQDVSSGLDPALLNLGEQEVQMMAELIRDRAPKMVANLKTKVQVGDANWTASEKASAFKDGTGTIELSKSGFDSLPIATAIPYSDENVALLLRTIQDEAQGAQVMGAEISPRADLGRVRAAISAVEGQVVAF